MIAESKNLPGVRSKARVFISYSRKDMAFADRLETALKARGFEPLIDRSEIYAFEDWWKRIEALIVRADTVVFIVSPDSIASDVALKEIEFAASLNKRFAPIVCRPVDGNRIPEAIARLNFIFFDDPEQFEFSADRLAEALATDIGWVRQHTEFGEAARRWLSAKAPKGLLLRSPVLEEAERWIAIRPDGAPPPTDETQKFIAESRRAATSRKNLLAGSLGDVAACENACRNASQCAAYSFNKWNRACFLKSAVNVLRLEPRSVTGVRRDVPVAYAMDPVVMQRFRGKVFPGTGYFTGISSLDDCERACVNSDCVAYSFSKAARRCTLFAETGEYLPETGVDSGIKVQPVN